MKNALARLSNYLLTEIDPAFALRASLLFQAVAQKQPRRVLEVGCGRGFYVRALAEFASIKRIDGVEIEPDYLRLAQQTASHPKVTLVQGSVYALPYPDRSFDVVILTEVLEHLEDEQAALLEIKRVLKKGGWLLMSVPSQDFPFAWDPLNWLLMRLVGTHINKDIWWLAGIWAGHERLYTSSRFVTVVESAGFVVKAYHSVVSYCWPGTHFWLYGVGKNIVEGLGMTHFSRFNFTDQKPIARFLAAIMSWPERVFGNLFPTLQVVNQRRDLVVSNKPSANHFLVAQL